MSYWRRKKYQNLSLLLSLACPQGTYGPYCVEKCDCHRDADCDPVTGQCRCPPGRTGPECKQSK